MRSQIATARMCGKLEANQKPQMDKNNLFENEFEII